MFALCCALGVLLLALGLRYGRAGYAHLAELRLRGTYFAFVAVAAQVLAMVSQHRIAPLLISLVCLTTFCWLNRRCSGMAFVFGGVMLNLIVMLANGGVMPVNAEAFAVVQGVAVDQASIQGPAKSAVIADQLAALAWMGDRLLLPGPLTRLAAWSIGDVIMIAGIGVLLGNTMRGRNYGTAKSSHRMA
jgi:Family of unknown function (DUF5317)